MRHSRPRHCQIQGWWGRCSWPTGSRLLPHPHVADLWSPPLQRLIKAQGLTGLYGGLASHLSPRGVLESHFSLQVPLFLNFGDCSLPSASRQVEEMLCLCVLLSFFFLLLEEPMFFSPFLHLRPNPNYSTYHIQKQLAIICVLQVNLAYFKGNGVPPSGVEGGFGKVWCHHDFLSFKVTWIQEENIFIYFKSSKNFTSIC